MKINRYQRILVVTDGLRTSAPVHETALSLATDHSAEVMIVDTLQPPTTVARWLTSNATEVFEMVLADKQDRLEKIAEGFRKEGVDVQTKVLLGRSSEAITLEAIDWDASLVIRYMKGVRSKFSGIYGNTARALMQICPAPILFVGKTAIEKPRVLACIDTEHQSQENESILSQSIGLAVEKDRLMALNCWEMYGRDMMEKRMNPSAFEQSIEFAESIHRKSFDQFVQANDLAMFGGGVRFENGEPSILIPQFCHHEEIDVVVMCSASLNHPLRRYFGSTIEAVIEQLPCSLLVVKPIGFVSPIAETTSHVVA